MSMIRNNVDPTKFNDEAHLPYELRLKDFEIAMQDVYDFFYDVNSHLARKGLQVTTEDFRRNPRGELGTRTATLHRDGIKKLRENWIYRL